MQCGLRQIQFTITNEFKMTINININTPDSQEILHILHRIEDKMNEIEQKVDDLRIAFDDATNELAARIEAKVQALKDQIAKGTITPAQLDTAFQPEIDRLKILGTDPVDPVPGE